MQPIIPCFLQFRNITDLINQFTMVPLLTSLLQSLIGTEENIIFPSPLERLLLTATSATTSFPHQQPAQYHQK
jgi:hypothetical protein